MDSKVGLLSLLTRVLNLIVLGTSRGYQYKLLIVMKSKLAHSDQQITRILFSHHACYSRTLVQLEDL